MLILTQLQPIAVIFTLPEDVLPTVAQHMKQGTLEVDAFSRDDQTKLATGKLLTIDNQIDPTTGTAKLKAVFDNKDNQLWPNQFVNANLLLETRKNSTVVPDGGDFARAAGHVRLRGELRQDGASTARDRGADAGRHHGDHEPDSTPATRWSPTARTNCKRGSRIEPRNASPSGGASGGRGGTTVARRRRSENRFGDLGFRQSGTSGS